MGHHSKAKFIPGVKGGTDIKYEKEQAKLVQSLTILPRISLTNVTVAAFRSWIEARLTELVGFDDEILVGIVLNTLEGQEKVEAGEIILLLAPFMGKGNAQKFVQELWKWIEEAKSTGGIPPEFAASYAIQLEKEKRDIEEQKRIAFERRQNIAKPQNKINPSSSDRVTRRRGGGESLSPKRRKDRDERNYDGRDYDRLNYDGRNCDQRTSPSPPRNLQRKSPPHTSKKQRFFYSKSQSRSPRRDTVKHSPPRRTCPISPRTPQSPTQSSSSYSSEALPTPERVLAEKVDEEETRASELRLRALRLMQQD